MNRLTKGLAALAAVTLGIGLAVGTGVAAASADDAPIITVQHTWLIPTTATGITAGHTSVNATAFPQSSVGVGYIAPTCGTRVQQDTYKGTQAQIDALLAAGPLTWNVAKGHASDNDFGLQVTDWTFVIADACPTDVPILPVTQAFTCDAGTTYTVPVQDDRIKYALESDGVTRPVPGTFSLAAGVSITIDAHTTAEAVAAGAAPGSYEITITGASTNTLDCYPPVACTLNGSSDTEAGDLAPTQTAEGLEFDGPTAVGQARDVYYRVSSGNLQGVTGISFTIAPDAVETATGYTAQVVIEVNPNADLGSGVKHYATISAFTSGTGTFSNMENSAIWWTTKIAYGSPGGQGDPITLAAMEALMPANTLISAPSLHLQSNSPADAHSVVTALTSSCGSFDYVPVQPGALFSTTVVTGDVVCSTEGGGSYDTVTHYFEQDATWNAVSASYTFTETPFEYKDATTVTTVVEVGADCPDTVTPVPPTINVSTHCDVNSTVILPGDATDSGSATVDASYVLVTAVDQNSATVTATPLNDGIVFAAPGAGDTYTVNDSGQAVWTLGSLLSLPCPSTVVTTLVTTGVDAMPYVIAFLALLLVGGSLLIISRRKRAEQE